MIRSLKRIIISGLVVIIPVTALCLFLIVLPTPSSKNCTNMDTVVIIEATYYEYDIYDNDTIPIDTIVVTLKE